MEYIIEYNSVNLPKVIDWFRAPVSDHYTFANYISFFICCSVIRAMKGKASFLEPEGISLYICNRHLTHHSSNVISWDSRNNYHFP